MERTVSAGSPRSTGPSPMAGPGRYHGSRGPQAAGAQAPEPEEPWQAGRCTTTRQQPNTLQGNWYKAEVQQEVLEIRRRRRMRWRRRRWDGRSRSHGWVVRAARAS